MRQLNAIIYDRRAIEDPFPTADPALAQLHDQLTAKDLDTLHAPRFAEQVRAYVSKYLSRGDVDIDQVLAHFAMSKRTFQRKLKEEDQTFLQLVDQMKMELAARYMKDSDMSVEEVAFLLGFTERGNFARAFRRWFNCTPREYRLRFS